MARRVFIAALLAGAIGAGTLPATRAEPCCDASASAVAPCREMTALPCCRSTSAAEPAQAATPAPPHLWLRREPGPPVIARAACLSHAAWSHVRSDRIGLATTVLRL
jgi:hypothetical protein